MRPALAAAAALLVAALVASCAETAGQAETAEAPAENGDTSDGGEGSDDQHLGQVPEDVPGYPHSGAPAVDDPITDLTEFRDDPCAILPEEGLEDIGLDLPPPESEPGSAICDYTFEAGGIGAFGSVIFQSGGLSGDYAAKEEGRFELLEEIDDIEGHPAVISGSRDERDEGICTVGVGLNELTAYYVEIPRSSDNPFEDAPCEAAEELATLGMRTMKGAS